MLVSGRVNRMERYWRDMGWLWSISFGKTWSNLFEETPTTHPKSSKPIMRTSYAWCGSEPMIPVISVWSEYSTTVRPLSKPREKCEIKQSSGRNCSLQLIWGTSGLMVVTVDWPNLKEHPSLTLAVYEFLVVSLLPSHQQYRLKNLLSGLFIKLSRKTRPKTLRLQHPGGLALPQLPCLA